jgi:hypothetical protein
VTFLKEQNVKENIVLKEQQLEEWPCPNFVMFLVKFNKKGYFQTTNNFLSVRIVFRTQMCFTTTQKSN